VRPSSAITDMSAMTLRWVAAVYYEYEQWEKWHVASCLLAHNLLVVTTFLKRNTGPIYARSRSPVLYVRAEGLMSRSHDADAMSIID